MVLPNFIHDFDCILVYHMKNWPNGSTRDGHYLIGSQDCVNGLINVCKRSFRSIGNLMAEKCNGTGLIDSIECGQEIYATFDLNQF